MGEDTEAVSSCACTHKLISIPIIKSTLRWFSMAGGWWWLVLGCRDFPFFTQAISKEILLYQSARIRSANMGTIANTRQAFFHPITSGCFHGTNMSGLERRGTVHSTAYAFAQHGCCCYCNHVAFQNRINKCFTFASDETVCIHNVAGSCDSEPGSLPRYGHWFKGRESKRSGPERRPACTWRRIRWLPSFLFLLLLFCAGMPQILLQYLRECFSWSFPLFFLLYRSIDLHLFAHLATSSIDSLIHTKR